MKEFVIIINDIQDRVFYLKIQNKDTGIYYSKVENGVELFGADLRDFATDCREDATIFADKDICGQCITRLYSRGCKYQDFEIFELKHLRRERPFYKKKPKESKASIERKRREKEAKEKDRKKRLEKKLRDKDKAFARKAGIKMAEQKRKGE